MTKYKDLNLGDRFTFRPNGTQVFTRGKGGHYNALGVNPKVSPGTEVFNMGPMPKTNAEFLDQEDDRETMVERHARHLRQIKDGSLSREETRRILGDT